ncbi:uncharacterized protein LOC126215235 [Schistocerca nitens]|uniref:uncharacterized protein LOC126215235 n=1 Tax=Schistocerca nitens TaxID=7011 RepID=UPI002117ABB5|nr:uncharacterized protein LOC126215235 [Schistocerca nitens]
MGKDCQYLNHRQRTKPLQQAQENPHEPSCSTRTDPALTNTQQHRVNPRVGILFHFYENRTKKNMQQMTQLLSGVQQLIAAQHQSTSPAAVGPTDRPTCTPPYTAFNHEEETWQEYSVLTVRRRSCEGSAGRRGSKY